MAKTLIALPLAAALAACVAAAPTMAEYAFVGTWECEVATFTFTDTSYDNGAERQPIRAVEQDGSNFTLYLEDGYRIGLGAVTETGMTWVSGVTGDQFNCRRVN